MRNVGAFFSAGLIFLFASSSSHAQEYEFFRIHPMPPIANEALTGELLAGPPPRPCLLAEPNPQGDTHSSSVQGNTIILDMSLNNTTFCVFPTSALFDIPALPAGNYTLILNRVDPSVSFPAEESDRERLGEISFSVLPAATTVSAISTVGLIWLVIGIGLVLLVSGGVRAYSSS